MPVQPTPKPEPTSVNALELGRLIERVDADCEHSERIEKKLDALILSITGTPEVKGMAGHVRDLTAWRDELESESPLIVQLRDLRDAQADLTRDLNRILSAIKYVGGPLVIAILIGALSLLWGLLTNRIELIFH